MVDMKILSNRVLVKKAPEKARKSLLLLPDENNEPSWIIVSIPLFGLTDREKEILGQLKEGDQIISTKYGPSEVSFGGESFWHIGITEILGKVE